MKLFFGNFVEDNRPLGVKDVELHLFTTLLYFESLKRLHFNANKVKLLSRTVKCFSEHLMVISLPRQTNKVVYISSDINGIPKNKHCVLWLLQNCCEGIFMSCRQQT